MRIICIPKDFEEITNDRSAYNGMVNPGEVDISPRTISLYEDDKGLFNCPTKIIYYPETSWDYDFKIPVSAIVKASTRRVLKYYSQSYMFYIRNVMHEQWSQYHFGAPGIRSNEVKPVALKKGIERAQNYPDNKLGKEYESEEDKLCKYLWSNGMYHYFDIFYYYPDSVILVTGRYEIYFTRFGLESEHRFIDIIVDYSEIKQK